MPLSLKRGTVTAIVERLAGLDRIEVDGEACVSYPRTTGPVEVGDEVVINVQAQQLGLGSGGFHVLYANLTRGLGLDPEPGAHVMTLPYSPVQKAVQFVEEDADLAIDLQDMPVVCCSLHSQVAPAVAGVGEGVRIAYVQLAGGALPVSLSDSLRVLKECGLVEVAIATGACFDGDVQAVNVASALAWVAAEGIDVTVCGVGPGIVGTGSSLGHGGVAAAEAANVTNALHGSPVVAVRVSEGDPRERHRGVSHHTRAALGLVLDEVSVAWPAGLEAPAWLSEREEVDVEGWQDACEGLILEHMGRGADEDPWFFASAFAAGKLARRIIV
jgi:Protein of unknown function (DUF3866)